MKQLSFMVVAGEPSGDLLAAELVRELRHQTLRAGGGPAAVFFGAGGSHLHEAGVHLDFDLTRHAVVGLVEVLRKGLLFRRLLLRLADLACERQPDVIVLVDFSGFNRRLAHVIRARARRQHGPFRNWRPWIVQYVSPQVWASRPARADAMAKDVDLLLCLFPFEKAWYANRVPQFNVRFVGHPLVDRYPPPPATPCPAENHPPSGVLLPGSRDRELRAHLPPMLQALALLSSDPGWPIRRWSLVLPSSRALSLAQEILTAQAHTGICRLDQQNDQVLFPAQGAPAAVLHCQVGNLDAALTRSSLALACSGTVTLECAWFRVPTVVVYRTSRTTYWIARQIVTVRYLAMPNLLANAPVFPELIQDQVTGPGIARAARDLLQNDAHRLEVGASLERIAASLGPPGAVGRAAAEILSATAFPNALGDRGAG